MELFETLVNIAKKSFCANFLLVAEKFVSSSFSHGTFDHKDVCLNCQKFIKFEQISGKAGAL